MNLADRIISFLEEVVKAGWGILLLVFIVTLAVLSVSGEPQRTVFGPFKLSGYFEMSEMTAPAAPAANGARLHCKDIGGKTSCGFLFNSGAYQQIAIEP